MKKVAIIGTVGVPACYGGFETLVENLVTKKVNKDINYQVYCSSKHYKQKMKTFCGAKLIYIPLNANGWQSTFYDIFCMIHAYFTCDVILSLGTAGCLISPILNFFHHKKVIINYDGIDCGRKKWNYFVQKYIAFIDWFASKVCDYGISDNAAIQRNVLKKYGKKSELIEYGGDNASKVEADVKFYEYYHVYPKNYILNIARIEPENNIHLILETAKQIPEKEFVFIGNWEHSSYGKNLRKQFSKERNIHMFNPIYETKTINMLRSNCMFYIHGHSVGGTNPTLVEAMSLGLAIFAYDVIYNRETTEGKAKYFSSVKELKKLIESTNQSEQYRLCCSMHDIAERRYRWEVICQKYESLLERAFIK